MKKLLSIVLVLLSITVLFVGCGDKETGNTNNQKVEELLSEGKFADAYKTAESSELKDLVMAENLLSIYCYDLNKNVDSNIKLVEGYFGQVQASEEDKYLPNNETLAINNYAKLAEYVALLRNEDVLSDYYYGLVKVLVEEDTEAYGFVSLSKKDFTFNPITTWFTLEQDEDDQVLEDLYKYIARKLTKDGVQISNEAVKRINKKYLSDSPEKVEFEIKQ